MGRGFPDDLFRADQRRHFHQGTWALPILAPIWLALAVFVPILTAAERSAAAQAGALELERCERSANIYWLGIKELRSFLRDFVLLGLVVYAFSLAVIAAGAKQFAGGAQRLDRHRRRGPFRAFAPDRPGVPAALFPAAAADRRTGHHAGDEQRKVYVRGGYPAEFRARCPGRPPTRDPDQCRCDGDGAGRPRLRLCAADHHDRDRRFPLPCGGRAADASQSRRADRVQSECHDRLVHQRDGRSSTTSPCWRSFWPARPSCASASMAPWTICWSCR